MSAFSSQEHGTSYANPMAVQQMSRSSPSERARQQFDENLKRMFQEQVEQELPDRFKELPAKLQDQDKRKDESGSE